jgi:hypothetical protein
MDFAVIFRISNTQCVTNLEQGAGLIMEPIYALALIIVVAVLLLTVFFWYVLPVIWKYLLRPLGKLAYFLLLVVFGISFFLIFAVGKQLGIPEEVQIAFAVFSAIVSGVKWASKRVYRMK